MTSKILPALIGSLGLLACTSPNPTLAKLDVGSACDSDDDCAGPGVPRCIERIRPLAGLSDNPALTGIGVEFPGGYCSTEPNCATDADCGKGGSCFWPLEHVTPEVVAEMGKTIMTDISSFARYGVCLKACAQDGECRPGYVCQVPIGGLISVVPGATLKTFCVGDPACHQCSVNATCQVDTAPPRCVCKDGFAGDGFTCDPAACAGKCGANATCGSDGACRCKEGFAGDPATGCVDIDDCAARPCLHGKCSDAGVGKFTCACDPGYSGERCDQESDPCQPMNPCMNGATCYKTGATTFRCLCAAGYTGARCEVNIDDCAARPCRNGGTCMDAVNDFVCMCPMGWSGKRCDIDVNECLASPCKNGGACTNLAGRFTCKCLSAWTGATCETDVNECLASPCKNGGSCANTLGGFTCTCAAGYSGALCESKANHCQPNPCKNGGACVDGATGYTCNCLPGWSGKVCEIAVTGCQPNPCLNGGTCSTSGGSYSCKCAAGYSGNNCQSNIDECAGAPCKNGGICVDGVASYTCKCATGWTGATCETDVDECAASPCLHSGACTNTPGGYKCACASGWTGATCETDVDECAMNPCQNAGACGNTPGGYTCTCVGGFTGKNCETPPSATYCDVVYRLDMPRAEFHVKKTGLGATDTYNQVGVNLLAPSVNNGETSPFTTTAFPRGFLRLRFPNVGGAPAAGQVQMIEYYLPLEFVVNSAGSTVQTNIDQSAGLLALVGGVVPASPTVSRACQALATGTLSGTTLTWAACGVATPAFVKGSEPMSWTPAQSQYSSGGSSGCMMRMSTYGRVTCSGGIGCPFVDTANQRFTWDQKPTSLAFSSTNYATATVALPEMTIPDAQSDVYTGVRIATATPFAVECGMAASLTCNEQ